MNVESSSADWRVIDFEVAGVNDDANRSSHGQSHAVDGAVRDRNKFDFVGADFNAAAGDNFAERCGIEKIGFA